MEGGPPIFGQGFTCPALLEDQRAPLPVPGCHRLRRAVPGASGSSSLITGLIRFRSPLLAESQLMSFPPATEMVQFAGFASPTYGFSRRYPKGVGCPIRTSEDQRLLATPLGFSQRATSFIASRCQGIHQMPFSRARPRPAPSTHFRRCQGQSDRKTEDRMSEDYRMPQLLASLFSVLWSLEPSARSAQACALAFAYPCPDPARRTRPEPLHGFTTRFTMSKEQRTENRADHPATRILCKLEEAGRQRPEIGSPVLLTFGGPDPTPENQNSRTGSPSTPGRRLSSVL